MEVILNTDIDRLGRAGQIVKVKDGFARNYLFPNRLAVPLTKENLRRLEEKKRQAESLKEKAKSQAEELKQKLTNVSLTIPVLIQQDEALYGSITAVDIARALKEEGFDIDKSSIELEEPIKKLGIYEISVKLHPEVTAVVKVWIVKK